MTDIAKRLKDRGPRGRRVMRGNNMTPTQFKQCRQTLGLTQRELARLLRLRSGGDRSIRHYEQGTKPVPGPVSVVLDILCSDFDPVADLHAEIYTNALRRAGM